jgi:hypothetical protein
MAGMKPGKVLEARDLLVDLRYRQTPGRGRAAAVREVMVELGPAGRQRVAEAEQAVAAKTARKRARKHAMPKSARPAETVQQQVDRLIRENLTAVQGPGVRRERVRPRIWPRWTEMSSMPGF